MSDLTRFFEKTSRIEHCTVFESNPSQRYGLFWYEGSYVGAHRWIWEQTHGEIAEGLHIHHVCRNERCVDTDHLELVSPAEHNDRHERKLADHCKRGHDLSDPDSYYPGKNQHGVATKGCKECARLRRRAKMLRKKGFHEEAERLLGS